MMAVWLFLFWERIGIARGIGGAEAPQDANFTMTGAKAMDLDIGVAELMDIALAENDRRLAPYDPRLLRPRFVPAAVRLVRRFLRPARPAPLAG